VPIGGFGQKGCKKNVTVEEGPPFRQAPFGGQGGAGRRRGM